MSVRVFVGKNQSSVKIIIGIKKELAKKIVIFADFFSSYRYNDVWNKLKMNIITWR